jgi:PII-like signaling protein
MKELNGDSSLLRIFIGESDMIDHKPLYEAIIYEAKKQGLAGGTVLKGIMSYGASSMLHTAKLLDISQDLPIVIEIIDHADKIDPFLEILNEMFEKCKCGGIITTEKVNVAYYRSGKR